MRQNEKSMILLFTAPIILVYLVIYLYPTLRTILLSFYQVKSLSDSFSQWKFNGISNYTNLFTNPLFVVSYWNIIKIASIGGVVVILLSVFFAFTFHGGMKGSKVFKGIIYLPNLITPVALVTMWTQYIFNDRYGLLHSVFSFMGLDSLASIPWNSTEWAFPSMLIAFCFGNVGYYTIIYLSAMEKIPDDFYGSASLDGASKFQMLFKITLPLLVETTKTAVTLWLISAINFFIWSRVFNVFPLAPETLVPASYMFALVFGGGSANSSDPSIMDIGGGTAIGVLLCLSIVGVFITINLLTKRERYEY